MNIFLILPTQLFYPDNNLLKKFDRIIILEDPYYINKNCHKQKLYLHFSTLYYYYELLNTKYKNVKYIPVDKVSYSKYKSHKIVLYDPIDDEIIKKLDGLDYILLNSPMFINSKNELAIYYNKTQDKKSISLNDFYKYQRKRRSILVKNNKPFFNKWSFDYANRNKFDSKFIEKDQLYFINEYKEEVITRINKDYCDNFGNLTNLDIYVTTHLYCKKYVKDILKKRILTFGKYQDAINKDIIYGSHMNLSMYLNIGLITPNEVLLEVLNIYNSYKRKKDIINSVEGFIRQLFWREYMRYVYIYYKSDILDLSYIKNGFNTKIKKSWYTGNTELNILNDMILKVQNHAYLHHIERLMIVNNLFILYNIKYNDIYKWFMTCFIDSYDWVMVGNVLMGINAVNPKFKYMKRIYICSYNYIKKMSNYKDKNDEDIINKLYWNFLKKNKDILKKDYTIAGLISKYIKS